MLIRKELLTLAALAVLLSFCGKPDSKRDDSQNTPKSKDSHEKNKEEVQSKESLQSEERDGAPTLSKGAEKSADVNPDANKNKVTPDLALTPSWILKKDTSGVQNNGLYSVPFSQSYRIHVQEYWYFQATISIVKNNKQWGDKTYTLARVDANNDKEVYVLEKSYYLGTTKATFRLERDPQSQTCVFNYSESGATQTKIENATGTCVIK